MPDCYKDGTDVWRCLVCSLPAPCPVHMKRPVAPDAVDPHGVSNTGKPSTRVEEQSSSSSSEHS